MVSVFNSFHGFVMKKKKTSIDATMGGKYSQLKSTDVPTGR